MSESDQIAKIYRKNLEENHVLIAEFRLFLHINQDLSGFTNSKLSCHAISVFRFRLFELFF